MSASFNTRTPYNLRIKCLRSVWLIARNLVQASRGQIQQQEKNTRCRPQHPSKQNAATSSTTRAEQQRWCMHALKAEHAQHRSDYGIHAWVLNQGYPNPTTLMSFTFGGSHLPFGQQVGELVALLLPVPPDPVIQQRAPLVGQHEALDDLGVGDNRHHIPALKGGAWGCGGVQGVAGSVCVRVCARTCAARQHACVLCVFACTIVLVRAHVLHRSRGCQLAQANGATWAQWAGPF